MYTQYTTMINDRVNENAGLLAYLYNVIIYLILLPCLHEENNKLTKF